MGLIHTSFVIVGFALIFQIVYDVLHSTLPTTVHGEVDDNFSSIREAFIANFDSKWENDGAAVTVYYHGKKVVDLWGGYADRQAAREWKQDTLSILFSTTKAVAAVCVALLVDRGQLRYADPVSKYWPGFAKHGKGNVTIQMALSHMAGLGYVDTPISEEMALDHNQMRRLLEEEKPKWPPGTGTGYHPYTYGWLVDQIIRHADTKKRGIGQFLREEITQPHNIDFHIGLPTNQAYRVARISTPTLWQRVKEVVHDFRVIVYFRHLFQLMRDTPLSRAVNNPLWLEAVSRCTLNNPDYYVMEQAGALGIGNARSLAGLFQLLISGRLISEPLLEKLQHFHINETDLIFGDTVAKGNGLLYLPLDRAGTPYLVGHNGHGCQQIVYDLRNQLVISYVSNGLKTGMYDLCRTYMRLQNTIYDVVERLGDHSN